jgi:hypothetical protein
MAIQQALFIPCVYDLYCIITYTDANDNVYQDGNAMNVIFSESTGDEAIPHICSTTRVCCIEINV